MLQQKSVIRVDLGRQASAAHKNHGDKKKKRLKFACLLFPQCLDLWMLNITIKSVEKVEKIKEQHLTCGSVLHLNWMTACKKKTLHSSYCLLLFLSFYWMREWGSWLVLKAHLSLCKAHCWSKLSVRLRQSVSQKADITFPCHTWSDKSFLSASTTSKTFSNIRDIV